MRILHLMSSSGYYGAESMLVTLARTLNGQGQQTMLAVFADGRDPQPALATRAAQQGLAVETVPCEGRWDAGVTRRILAAIQRFGADIVHTHGYKADFYAHRAVKGRRVGLIATCHNWPDPRPLMQAYAILDRWMLRGFDKVIAVSEPVANMLLQSGVPRTKVEFVANGVRVNAFVNAIPALRIEQQWGGRPAIGFAGRLVPAKGGAVLLRAAAIVLAEFPDAVFALAGEGPAREDWEGLAANLGISDHVLFAGSCTDMPGFFASIDVMVLPSFEEATPMSVLEAMAASRPVVASDVGGIPKVIENGIQGVLVEPGDVVALAAAILDLLRDPSKMGAVGRAGHDRVVRHYSADHVTQRYTGIYQEILQARGGSIPLQSRWKEPC